MDTKGLGVVGILLFLGVLLGAIGFMPTYEHNVAVQESAPAPGVVQSTDIDVNTDDDGDRTYHPSVVYEYVVDGQTYTQDNTFPGRFSRYRGSRAWAERIVAQYGPGDEVTVHYQPSDHSRAYLRNDGWPSSWWIGAAYAVIAAVGGLWLVRVGFRRWKQRQLIATTPTEKTRSLSVGHSELKGNAVLEDLDPITAPFSEEDCVVASYEVQEYDEGDDDDPGSWHTVEEGTLHTPFYLADDTGAVRVEPHDGAVFDLEPEDWTETYVDSGDRGPAPVQAFVQRTDGLDFPAHSAGKDNDRKYRQNLIRPEESVYVFGNVQPTDVDVTGGTNDDRLVVTRDKAGALPEDAMYMISDDTERDLIDRRKWTIWHAFAGGFFLVVALAVTLAIFSPMLGIGLPVLF